MTAQFPETLRYQGKDVAMFSEPLGQYFAMGGFEPSFGGSCTALWRGYEGHWEIVDDRLYLIGLQASLADDTPATLATIFPGFPDRVFAHWYSGTIRLPRGKLLEYVHAGYASRYEIDVFLEIERGVVVETRVRHNRANEPEDSAEDGEVGTSWEAQSRTREDNRRTS